MRRFPGFLLLLTLTILSACSRPAQVLEFSGSTMGTSYNIKLGEIPENQILEGLGHRIEQKLATINAHMSTYDRSSELSQFNETRSTDWFPVSRELVEVVSRAQAISMISQGAFDATVQPLVELWGFGSRGSLDRPPPTMQIAAARAKTGYSKLKWRLQPPALRKLQPDIEVDLSAIAKGYAVDEVAKELERTGIGSFLVEIGGELRGKGRKTGGEPWRIAVQMPDADTGSVQRVIELKDAAVATSGDYMNYFESEGKRYSHAIDPRTGRPVSHRLSSVTVIAANCAEADGLATALLVMGPELGPAFADENEIAALFITRTGDRHQERMTARFQHLATPPSQKDSNSGDRR